MIGKQFTAYSANGRVTGVLVDYNDYDLSFVQAEILGDYKWAEMIGESIVVDRNAIIWLEEKS